MRKVVIDDGFGFGLSRKAFLRLREMGNEYALEYPDYGEPWKDGSINEKERGFGDDFLSFGERDIPRDNPDLVAVVEEIGKKANGYFAKLVVIEIPDDVEWEIHECECGGEWIAEKHRCWYAP